MGLNRRQVMGWLAGIVLILLAAQVLPFLLPHDPGPLPPEAQGLLEAESYAHPLPPAGLARRVTSYAGLGLILVSGLAVRLERRHGRRASRWPARILFLTAVYLWLWLLGTPHAVARYLHMLAFGLTDLTLPEWLRVAALGMPVPFLLFIMSYLLIYCCMPLLGRRWWIGGALLVLVFFQVLPEFVSRAQPVDPVETLTPLTEGPYLEALTRVAAAAETELDFFTVDQSERTRHVNMYLTGRLGREYVVVTDTLFEHLAPAEAAVMLAHELGHGVTRRTTVPMLKTLVVLKLLVALWLVHLVLGRQPVAEGRRLQALVMVMLTVRLVSFAFMPFSSALTRQRERAADVYALELTGNPEALAGALLKTAEINLEPYELPRWVYGLSGTHPSIRERLEMAGTWRGGGERPESPPGNVPD